MIKLVSCGLNEKTLTDVQKDAVSRADLLLGGVRLLDMFPSFCGEKIPLKSNIKTVLQNVFTRMPGREIVILGSGDALFFGIGALVAKLAKGIDVEYIPNISSVQAGAAKLGISWNQMAFYSVHGRSQRLPLYRISRNASTAILCDHSRTPAVISEEMIAFDASFGEISAAIVTNLGLENEHIIKCKICEVSKLYKSNSAKLAILYILDSTVGAKPLPLGMNDCEFRKDNNCITHAEVRAVVLSKLRISGGVLWDLGAGSGSVGIEAALLNPDIQVFAVEKNLSRCNNIKENIIKHSVSNIEVVQGDILENLSILASPDRIFIGGGGADINTIIKKSLEQLLPEGYLVLTAVMEETINCVYHEFKDMIAEMIELDVRRTKPLGSGSRMISDTPVRIICIKNDKIEK